MQRYNPPLFTESFIQDQKKLLIAASAAQGAVNEQLYNERELNLLLTEMAKINLVNIRKNDAGTQGFQDPGLNELYAQINAIRAALARGNKNHPTIKALGKIYSNIYMLAAHYDLVIYTVPKASAGEGVQGDAGLAVTPLLSQAAMSDAKSDANESKQVPARENLSDHQRLVDDLFIQRQKNILLAAEQASGQLEDELSNADILQPILDNMKLLVIANNEIKAANPVNYRYVLAQLDWATETFEENYRKNNSCVVWDHPVTAALKTVKKNFLAVAQLNASLAVQAEENKSEERSKATRMARWKKVGDVAGIGLCGVLYVPIKVVTLNSFFNGCDCCNNSHPNEGNCGLSGELDKVPAIIAPARLINRMVQNYADQNSAIVRNQNDENGSFEPPPAAMRMG